MIRVMVVEDEPPIMRQIIKLIEEYSDAYEVVATAGNGKKALELMENVNVDVVFSDIKMPLVDGLELAEQLKVKFPNVIVIIVSGYQDFQFARKAIQFHVYEYLLKPVSKDAMGNLLSAIEWEIQQKRNLEKKEKVISFINAVNTITTSNEKVNMTNDTQYAVFLVCAGAFPLIPDDSMLPGRNFWSQVSIEHIMESITLSDENCSCFNGKSTAEMIVAIELGEKERLSEIANNLLESLKERGNLFITIIPSNKTVRLNEIGAVIKALRTKLYVGIKLFKSQILWNSSDINNAGIDAKAIAETLNYAIKSGSVELKNCLFTAVNRFLAAELTQLQIVNFFDGLINNSEITDLQSGSYISNIKMEIYGAVSNAVDISLLTDDLTYILSNIYSAENDSKRFSNHSTAEKIELYLKNNYSQTITNTLLSKKFGFVPSYISKIFRAYKGMSPSEYLTYYRIDMSKKLIADQPDLLLKEVAEMVGFSDQHYFSKTFKKETGMWPTEYRSKK